MTITNYQISNNLHTQEKNLNYGVYSDFYTRPHYFAHKVEVVYCYHTVNIALLIIVLTYYYLFVL